MLLIMLW